MFYIFSGCRYLTSVIVKNATPISISSNVFPSRATTLLFVPEGSKEAYLAADYWKEFKDILEGNVYQGVVINGISYDLYDDGFKAIVVANSTTTYSRDITIPGSVTYKGNSYQVTFIGNGVFSGCKDLTSVTIPNSVISIGNYAFYGCDVLDTVKVMSEIPVSITNSVFANRANTTLYVPAGSKTAYEASDYWQEFNIVEYGTVAAKNITFADARAKALCVANWDTNSDGELSTYEAAAVKDLGNVFSGNTAITSFDELKYFKGLKNIGADEKLSLREVPFWAHTTGWGLDAPKTTTATPAWVVGESTVQPYGDENVENFADLSGYDKLVVVVSDGTPRFLFNRDQDEGQYNADEAQSHLIDNTKNGWEANYFSNEGGTWTVYLKKMTNDKGYAHLHAIKGANWLDVTVESMTLYSNTATAESEVTADIAKGFYGCTALTSVTIPTNVTALGDYAFSGCSSLASVTVRRMKPVAITEQCFTNRANATLYVPAGSKAAYEAADYWKEFGAIVEYETVGPTDISALTDAIYINSFSARVGESATMEICLKNAEDATAYFFDLVLPEGITVAKNESGKYIDALSDRHDDHSRTFNYKGNNIYSLATLSGNSELLTDHDGTIRILTLEVADDMAEGSYVIEIKNASYSTPTGYDIMLPETKALITVEDYILGDVNGNDRIDIGDAVSIVNYLVGKESTKFVEKAADTNKNGRIDIGDAVTIVNVLVGKATSFSRTIAVEQDEREPQ